MAKSSRRVPDEPKQFDLARKAMTGVLQAVGLRVNTLGLIAGVPASTIQSTFATKPRDPGYVRRDPIQTFRKIAKVLGITPAELTSLLEGVIPGDAPNVEAFAVRVAERERARINAEVAAYMIETERGIERMAPAALLDVLEHIGSPAQLTAVRTTLRGLVTAALKDR